MSQTSLHVYCYFDGISMSLPFGSPENYRRARAAAIGLVGPQGHAGPNASSEETFYLQTREQLDALFDLQRAFKAKSPADFAR